MEVKIDCAYDELVQVEKLVPNPMNPNRHSPEQLEILCKLITAHGWRHPIVVSKKSGFINCGEGRWNAAKTLGLEKIPVDYQDFETEAEEYQAMVSDNEIQRYSQLDLQAVHLAIDELPNINIDLLAIDDKFLNPEIVNYNEKNKEIDTENFGNDLQHCCPKCGFEFND